MSIFLTNTSSCAESKNSKKVVVVGAGLAGLTTAYRLQQKGIDVEIYEARNRVGGRILTVKIADKVVELGGQSIITNGEINHILRLIKELELELVENKANLNHFYFDGQKLLPVQQLVKHMQFDLETLKIQLNHLAKTSNNMREVLNGIFKEEDPLYKVLAVRLAGYEGAAIEKLSPFYANAVYRMLSNAAKEGQKENEEDFINLLSIKGGNALLPEKLAQMLAENLHLNAVLKKISKNLDDSFVLTFENGQQVTADIVVLAIPCSIYEDIMFEENIIPSNRLKQIKNVQYGTNAKIMIPFLKSSLKRMRFNTDHGGCFFDTNTNILTLHYTDLVDSFSTDGILDIYKQDRPMMESVFGTLCPSFISPMIARDEAFSVYEGPIGYSWPHDPYAKGSYTYLAAGQESLLTAIEEKQGEQVKALFAPINQNLYFVGEHTSILMDASGTMEAACESGERNARMILNFANL